MQGNSTSSPRRFDLRIEELPIAELKPRARNARTHSKKQISKIAASIKQFGFVNPVLIDGDNRIVAGHGRVEAAKKFGLDKAVHARRTMLVLAGRNSRRSKGAKALIN
jgi:ParB-like chromosome segregation protein Spo0J